MTAEDEAADRAHATHAEWLAAVRADLGGRDPDTLRTPVDAGVALQALFTRAELPPAQDLPGTPRPAPTAPAPLRLGWLHTAPIAGPDELPRLDGFELVRLADAGVEEQLAGGDIGLVRQLDPAAVALTLSATAAGARALATLVRADLPHAVVLDVIDRIDGEPPARELALSLAAAAEVLQGFGTDRALLPALADRLLVAVRVDTDVIVQVAKLRAARWLWHDLTAAFGATAAPPARIWAKASETCFSAVDPETNLVRGALQMFAAATAGCHALEPMLHDPVAAPALSQHLAANQLRLLREEAKAGRVHDPAAGAFAVEGLTAQIAHSAWGMLQAIAAKGGAGRTAGGRAALPVGGDAAPAARVLVGTNRFADPAARVTAAPPTAVARPAAPYEALRRRTARADVAVLLVPFGELGPARAATAWTTDLLRTAGIEPAQVPHCATPAAVRTALASHADARVVVCCGRDDAAGTFVRGVLAALGREPAPRPLLYATGTAPAGSEGWGAVGFLHGGLDAAGTISGILDRLAVR